MRNVDRLARSIAIAEGFQDRAGTMLALAPARRRNPGSLRASSFASSNVNGYAVFDTIEAGWKGLYRQIGLDRDRRLTLEQFVYKFAPPTENRTAEYLALVERETGLKRTDRLDVVIESFPTRAPVLMAGLPGVATAPDTSAPAGPILAASVIPALGDLPLEVWLGLFSAGVLAMALGSSKSA